MKPPRDAQEGCGRRSRAFTLIEIMLVLGLMAMVLTMGIPPMVRAFRQEPLHQGVRDLSEALSQARWQAVLKGRPAEMILEAGSGKMRVDVVKAARVSEPTGEEPGPAATPTVDKKAFEAKLDEDVAVTLVYINLRDAMELAEARVRFYPNGTADDFTIVLEHSTGVRQITLDPITGHVEVTPLR